MHPRALRRRQLRTLFRSIAVIAVVFSGWLGPLPTADAAILDTTADFVFGQAGSFSSATANKNGLNENSLATPAGVAVDAHGNVYVADQFNNRVLAYDAPLTQGAAADRIFGQYDFTHNYENEGHIPTAETLYDPNGVAVDAQGNLYVADLDNNRVLEYDAPLSNAVADHVFGQPDFTHGAANNGGRSAHSLDIPDGVSVDGLGNLYVSDAGNNRVLAYDAPLSTGMDTNRVYGQGGSFTTGTANKNGIGAASLAGPA